MKTCKIMGMLVATAALVLTSVGSQAAVLLTSVTGGAAVDGDWEAGYRFTTTTGILVEQLGFIDLESSGLASSHQVTLWDSGGSLGSVTVQAGTSSTLDGQFRYETLSAPITLAPNTAYMLTASTYTGGDKWYNETSTYTLGLPVTINGTQLGYPQGSYPGSFGAGGGYFTANLLGENLVPEPSSVILLGLGGLLCLIRGKRVG